jgi:bacteriorhodopsin
VKLEIKNEPDTNRPTCNVIGCFLFVIWEHQKYLYYNVGMVGFIMRGEIVIRTIVKGVPANTTTTRKASPFKTHFTVIFRKSYRSNQSDA